MPNHQLVGIGDPMDHGYITVATAQVKRKFSQIFSI